MQMERQVETSSRMKRMSLILERVPLGNLVVRQGNKKVPLKKKCSAEVSSEVPRVRKAFGRNFQIRQSLVYRCWKVQQVQIHNLKHLVKPLLVNLNRYSRVTISLLQQIVTKMQKVVLQQRWLTLQTLQNMHRVNL